MAYPGYGRGFGNFHVQMPGIQIQMGQPVPETGPQVLLGGYPGYPAYSDSYPSASDPMWTYFSAVAGQDGEVDAEELQRCLTQSGISGTYSRYRLSPQALTTIVKRYSKNGRIFFDDYVACCVKLRALTDFFRGRDPLQQGFVNFLYDDVSMLFNTFDIYIKTNKPVLEEVQPECSP
ncbi:grancalcin isoform 6-T6 [Trichechus inunguis]|uniref:Grancalcin isoform X6 n=1 Tax=Trichechus manatus latirostris TaxID=127582 RepID=A0A2Y9R3R4_TRIMA|nr:grancalcin isoform X6 [Trichechus manatus latirostris]